MSQNHLKRTEQDNIMTVVYDLSSLNDDWHKKITGLIFEGYQQGFVRSFERGDVVNTNSVTKPTKDEYYATFYDYDTFNEGPFDSVEKAKACIVEMFEEDLANEVHEPDGSEGFQVGLLRPMPEIAREYAKDADYIIEHLCERIDDYWCADEPSIPTSQKNIDLMKDLLNRFFDKCEYGASGMIDNVQEFKFSEVQIDKPSD